VTAPAALVWFRDDLRLDDNPALTAAAAEGPVVALFVLERVEGARALGGAAKWWLHHALASLREDLAARGVPLVLRRGDPRAIVPDVARALGAGGVHWNRRYLPWSKPVDAEVKRRLADVGHAVESHNGALLVEPWRIATGTGGPFKVFSPFMKALRAHIGAHGLAVSPPPDMRGPAVPAPEGDALVEWRLLPKKPDWAGGLRETWTPGEAGAREALDLFLETRLMGYGEARNLPGVEATSRLSPRLRFGEIGPRRVWARTIDAMAETPALAADGWKFLSELGWREFSWHLLHHFEHFATRNWRADFDRFPWADRPDLVEAWRAGRTGYPIVDAGMRQLWRTGWMHNRVRMIVGSFLVKHLLTDWRTGEEWFWDTLVDADPANNAAGWQWIAGSGVDAAPYFRVFNPMTQGQKFDPEGDYVRRFVPELSRLPTAFIHAPWTASPAILEASGVRLGDVYPRPIVEHGAARERALAAFATLKGEATV
jgi:deoxyribodipyrimidine photo-lyase